MYYASSATRAKKEKTAVTVVTADGEMFDGSFFVAGHQRVTDLLNTEHAFVPFETTGGLIYIFNKRFIARVMPRKAPEESA